MEYEWEMKTVMMELMIKKAVKTLVKDLSKDGYASTLETLKPQQNVHSSVGMDSR